MKERAYEIASSGGAWRFFADNMGLAKAHADCLARSDVFWMLFEDEDGNPLPWNVKYLGWAEADDITNDEIMEL